MTKPAIQLNNQLSFRSQSNFHEWLLANYIQVEPIYIEFYKDGTKGISYQEALEEALCFGWIDSLIKRVDERIYVRKFQKRLKKSKWSEVNKRLVNRLTEEGKMQKPGLQAVSVARENGEWERGDTRPEFTDVEGFRQVLISKIGNSEAFDKLSLPLQEHYSLVYFSARKAETRAERLRKIIEFMKIHKRFL